MAPRLTRVVVATELAGSLGEFGGSRSRICPLLAHIKACADNSPEVTARLVGDVMLTVTHAVTSRAHSSDILCVTAGPDRGRELCVVAKQRRAYSGGNPLRSVGDAQMRPPVSRGARMAGVLAGALPRVPESAEEKSPYARTVGGGTPGK